MSELRANTISNAAGTGPVTLTGQSAAKAYVYASNSAVPIKSLNVSSGTDNGVGNYTFSFTNAFDSASYAHCVEGETNVGRITGDGSAGKSSSSMVTLVFHSGGTATDNPTSNSVFGDLA